MAKLIIESGVQEIPVNKLKPTEQWYKNPKVKDIINDARHGWNYEPISVSDEGDHYKILDGHHRASAAKIMRRNTINAIVYPKGHKFFL